MNLIKLYIPARYKRNSLHVWCNDCNKVVSKKPCSHLSQQRFQSRIWNPNTKKTDCIQTHETRDIDAAFNLHQEYKKELKVNNYFMSQPEVKPTEKQPVYLKEFTQRYFDFLEDIGVEEYEIKDLDPDYIRDTTRYITRFLMVVKKLEGKISTFPLAAISKTHVGAFDVYLKAFISEKTGKPLSSRSYNIHIGAVRDFLSHCIREYDLSIENVFKKVRLKSISKKQLEIVTQDEFETLLSVITPENGRGTKGTRKQTVNYYRPWLKDAFKLALLSGERMDGIVLMVSDDIKENYIGVPNWKTNRNHRNKGREYICFAPITEDLAELLLALNISADPNEYILAPEVKNRKGLGEFMAAAFKHYWGVTRIDKYVTFKNLRKTYITRMKEVFGRMADGLKHTNESIEKIHYDAEQARMSGFKNGRLYDEFQD